VKRHATQPTVSRPRIDRARRELPSSSSKNGITRPIAVPSGRPQQGLTQNLRLRLPVVVGHAKLYSIVLFVE
jgi:hypothetical protein